MTARRKVLLEGLIDWVPLDDVHRLVARIQPDAPAEEVQPQVLQLIESLVAEGLVVLGDLANPESRFVAWDIPLADAMQRLRDVYVDGFADKNTWPWFCWLALTAKGTAAAETVEAQLPGRPDN